MIRVLAVDDHAIVRDGIARLVATQSDMEPVAEACDGREAIEQFRKHRPDVTLMDLQMPNMCGIDAIRHTLFALLSAFAALATPAVAETHYIQVVRGCVKSRDIERKESRW